MRKNIFLVILMLVLFSVKNIAQVRSVAIYEYINTYQELAIEEMKRSGVPASITLAQGILETDAGKSDLVLSSNNHFGIKCKSIWKGEKVYHDDDSKGECFRKYPKAEDSYMDHSDYLRSGTRYASLFKLDAENYKGWAKGLKAAGYATNPRYADILINYIEKYNLNQYTLIAMGKLEPIAADSSIVAVANGSEMETQSQGTQFLENIALSTGNETNSTVKYVSVNHQKTVKNEPQQKEIKKIKHIVKRNDTLSAITKKYGVSKSLVAEWNNLKRSKLRVGQELVIYK
jgi:LysM repeat protein